jgi:hypothetical protein
LLGAFFVLFLIGKELATPASWNSEGWYRAAVLEEMKQQPLVYGGISDLSRSERNAACQSCHAKEDKTLRKNKHKKLSCESCHGPLSVHAEDEKKIADAVVDRSREQCANCHSEQISRPQGFPLFTMEVDKHKTMLKEDLLCLKCHEAHDPTN